MKFLAPHQYTGGREISDSRQFLYAGSSDPPSIAQFQQLSTHSIDNLRIRTPTHKVFHPGTGVLALSSARGTIRGAQAEVVLAIQESSGKIALIVGDPISEHCTTRSGSLDLPLKAGTDPYILCKDAWEQSHAAAADRRRHRQQEDRARPSGAEMHLPPTLDQIIGAVQALSLRTDVQFTNLQTELRPIRRALREITQEDPAHPLTPALEEMRACEDLELNFGAQEPHATTKCQEILQNLLQRLEGRTATACSHLSAAEMSRYENAAHLAREFLAGLQSASFCIEAFRQAHPRMTHTTRVPAQVQAHIRSHLGLAPNAVDFEVRADVLSELGVLPKESRALVTALTQARGLDLSRASNLIKLGTQLQLLLWNWEPERRIVLDQIKACIFTHGLVEPSLSIWEEFAAQVNATTRPDAAAQSVSWRGLERSWRAQELHELFLRYGGRLVVLQHAGSNGAWLLSLNAAKPPDFVARKLQRLEELGEYSEPASYAYLVRMLPSLTRLGIQQGIDLYQWLIDLEKGCALLDGNIFSMGRKRIHNPDTGRAGNASDRDHARVGYKDTSLVETEGPHRYRVIRTTTRPSWPEKP